MVALILAFTCGLGGYYVWCTYHPEVTIKVSEGPTGKENIKIEAPHIAVVPTGIAKPAASIELKLNAIVLQHESFCSYIKDTYATSDIKLDIKIQDNETTLIYSGIATTKDGKSNEIKKEYTCGFGIHANIKDNS